MKTDDLRIGERLRRHIAFRGISISDFAKELEIPYRTLQDYLSGKRKPSADQLTRMVNSGIDVNWLLTGDFVNQFAGLARGRSEKENFLFANQDLLEKLGKRCISIIDQFQQDRQESGESPKFSTLFDLYQRAVMMTFDVAGKISDNLVALKKAGVDNDTILDVVTSSLTHYLNTRASERSAGSGEDRSERQPEEGPE